MEPIDMYVSSEFLDRTIELLTEFGESMPHESTEQYKTLMMAFELKQRRKAISAGKDSD